jgi:subtilisin family serine protease
MAAYKPGEIIGTAFEASYLLLRTEKSGSENRVEEINWLLAAEYADSVGVDVINSSLGYNYFDDPAMNYSRADMNGNTAFSTRAADMAAATGILVVNSAGNEGNDSWQTLAAPADADSVLTVGAVNSTGMYATFSSKGPSADRRIKPDVSAQGQGTVLSSPSGNTIVSNGTSFSAPVIAGMAASFWQAFPTLTNMQVIDYLKRSASQFDSPDSLLGYGIPNYVKAAQLAEEELKTGEEICRIWPNPISNQEFTLWVNSAYVKEPLTIRIYDMAGRIINQQTILSAAATNTLSLASSFFPRGTYLLQVTSPSIRYVSRFMKL